MNEFLIFDGAMGTMLQAQGLPAGAFPETYNLTHPDVVLAVHKAYVEAGADVVTANTFGANPFKMKGMDVAEISVYSRATQGVRLMRVSEGSRVISIARTPKEGSEDETVLSEETQETEA